MKAKGAPVSVTTKLAVLFGSATIALIAATNLLLFHVVEREWNSYDRRNLELASDALKLVAGSVRTTAQLAGREASIAAAVSSNGRLSFAILDETGATVLSTLRQEVPGALLDEARATGDTVRWQPDRTQSYDLMVSPAATRSGAPLSLVLLLQVTSHVDMTRLLAQALIAITAVAGLLAALLGYLISRQGLAPLRRFAVAAGRITASRLGERLDASETPKELRELAASFNRMLERLQDSFRRIEEYSSDLAHELRTPINTLLGQTQVALSRRRSAAEYRDVLASNAEELERLSRMTGDMLFIARADEPHRELRLRAVELAAEVRAIAEFYEPMLEEKRMALDLRGSGTALADPALLRRAIGNLLSNAVRHSPESARIDVDILTEGSSGVAVCVSNTGPDIAPDQLPRLFDRFYRTDASRARGEGAGLGLAIVKTIAELHGGSVSARSDGGRTAFTLHLPAAPAAVPAVEAPEEPAVLAK